MERFEFLGWLSISEYCDHVSSTRTKGKSKTEVHNLLAILAAGFSLK